ILSELLNCNSFSLSILYVYSLYLPCITLYSFVSHDICRYLIISGHLLIILLYSPSSHSILSFYVIISLLGSF
ncbi:hypothetical protein NEQG_02683, partial [Nematocida parisii ERTm3]